MFKTNNQIVPIYKSKFTFQQLLSFIKVLANEELSIKEKDQYFSTSLTLKLDGKEIYSSKSFSEFIDDKNAVEEIKQRKVIGFSFIFGNYFSLYAGNSYFYIDYSPTEKSSTHLYHNAKKILNLRTKSTIFNLCKNIYFYYLMFLISVFSIIKFIYLDMSSLYISTVIFCFFFVFIGATSSFGKPIIIMGNNKDTFILRNKDSIIISLISTVFGFVLGLLFNNIEF